MSFSILALLYIFIPAHQLFLVHHHYHYHHHHKVHAPYVTTANAKCGVFGYPVLDCVPTWVVGGSMGLGGG